MGPPSGTETTWRFWLTWDVNYLYLGWSGPDSFPSNNDDVVAYIDARVGGTSAGLYPPTEETLTLGITADFATQIRQRVSNSGYYVYDGGWGSLTNFGVDDFLYTEGTPNEGTPDVSELRVSWSTVTNGLSSVPTPFNIIVVNRKNNGTYTAVWPSENTGLGKGTVSFTFAWEESGGEGATPNTFSAVDNLSDQSLPVGLSSFTAISEGDAVTLSWRTESEVDNLGFNLYRGESKDGPFVKVNYGMIPGAGNSANYNEYQYRDRNVKPNQRYFYYIEDVDLFSNNNKSQIIEVWVNRVSLLKFALFQNFPNPFNPETWIPYELAKDSEVTISIYNVFGQLIHTLSLGEKKAGRYINKDEAAYWDGKNDAGEKVSSRLYFYKLSAGDFATVKRMVIVK